MISELEKRIGYPRKMARQILKQYFKEHPLKLPIPIEDIAKYLSIEIYLIDSMGKYQRALKLDLNDDKRKLIGINSSFHKHNQRFSIGHEIGHYVMEHPSEESCNDEEIKTYNREADEFSAELLMPLEVMKKELRKNNDPKILARQFDVSEEALWIKIKNQGLLNLLIT